MDGAAFGFVALLGCHEPRGHDDQERHRAAGSDQHRAGEGKAPLDAILDAALSRLRPVVLAAGTTVLGVIPLLQDVFWVAMSVAIMAGLTFGTFVTMFLVPCLRHLVRDLLSRSEAGARSSFDRPDRCAVATHRRMELASLPLAPWRIEMLEASHRYFHRAADVLGSRQRFVTCC